MMQAISVWLDDEAIQALRALEASGMTRSEAIRTTLVDASKRLRLRRDLAAEAAALEADEADRGRCAKSQRSWSPCVRRSDVLRFKPSPRPRPRATPRGSQSCCKPMRCSPVRSSIVAPTSTSARPASFRPEIRSTDSVSTGCLSNRSAPSTSNDSDDRPGTSPKKNSGQSTKHSSRPRARLARHPGAADALSPSSTPHSVPAQLRLHSVLHVLARLTQTSIECMHGKLFQERRAARLRDREDGWPQR